MWGLVTLLVIHFFLFLRLFLGKLNEDYLRELLTTMGDRFNDDQVDEMFREAPIDNNTSEFDYRAVSLFIKPF